MGKPNRPELTDGQLSILADAAGIAYRDRRPSDPQVEQDLLSAVSVITDYLEAVQYVGTNPHFRGYESRRKWFAEQAAA